MESVIGVFYVVWDALFPRFFIFFVCLPIYLDVSEVVEFLTYDIGVSLYVIRTTQFGEEVNDDNNLCQQYIAADETLISYFGIYSAN